MTLSEAIKVVEGYGVQKSNVLPVKVVDALARVLNAARSVQSTEGASNGN